nr:nitrite reductase small subunit NirD [uncultured Roseateles sp.]
MSEWKTICKVDDIPVQGARRVQRKAGPQVAVFRASDDRVFALLDRCPHKGGPLSQGIVFGHSVACPLHNWTIALDSGEAQAPDVGCAVRFEVKLVEGQVLLNQQELDTLAIDLPALVAGPCSKVA